MKTNTLQMRTSAVESPSISNKIISERGSVGVVLDCNNKKLQLTAFNESLLYLV